ncbi:adenosylcobinamide-GDP ribazoletransferase, partial [Pseudomonas sp. F1002]
LGQALADHLPRIVGQQVLILSGLACILIGGFSGGIAVLVAALCFIGLRQLMVNRLGGTTGDTAGALLELLEVAVLISLVL